MIFMKYGKGTSKIISTNRENVRMSEEMYTEKKEELKWQLWEKAPY